MFQTLKCMAWTVVSRLGGKHGSCQGFSKGSHIREAEEDTDKPKVTSDSAIFEGMCTGYLVKALANKQTWFHFLQNSLPLNMFSSEKNDEMKSWAVHVTGPYINILTFRELIRKILFIVEWFSHLINLNTLRAHATCRRNGYLKYKNPQTFFFTIKHTLRNRETFWRELKVRNFFSFSRVFAKRTCRNIFLPQQKLYKHINGEKFSGTGQAKDLKVIVYDSVFIFCLVFYQEYLQDADKIARFFVSVSIGHPCCLNPRLVFFSYGCQCYLFVSVWIQTFQTRSSTIAGMPPSLLYTFCTWNANVDAVNSSFVWENYASKHNNQIWPAKIRCF